MKEYEEGGWYVFEERTTKSLGRFRVDASHGLDRRWAGLATRYEWQGSTCHVIAPGAEGFLTFEAGLVRCRVSIAWYMFMIRGRILSEIRNTTLDVCGTLGLTGKTVFIVHGHDLVNRAELQALLGGWGLQPIVLDEQDSIGMTIIEKLEHYAETCAFAIVLMTPDDLMQAGARARQNVVLELGWFMAKLGRERVLLLYTGETEIPSDIFGIVYVQFKVNVREVEGRIQQRLRGAGLIA
jgi:Predicted nucleotide-binding protein containing TIR-like domain